MTVQAAGRPAAFKALPEALQAECDVEGGARRGGGLEDEDLAFAEAACEIGHACEGIVRGAAARGSAGLRETDR